MKGVRRNPQSGRRGPAIVAELLAAAVAGWPAAAGACPMCQAAVGGPGDPLVQGVNASILFMLAMPFALTAAVGGWFWYMYRRASRSRSWPATPAREEGTW